MTDLFNDEAATMSIRLGHTGSIFARVWECLRCGSIVRDQDQHIAWHGAVDSNTTTDLPRTHDGIRADKAIHPRGRQ